MGPVLRWAVVLMVSAAAGCQGPVSDQEVRRIHQKDLAERRARIARLRAEIAAVEAEQGGISFDGFGNVKRPPNWEELYHRSVTLRDRLQSEEFNLRIQEKLSPDKWPVVPDQQRTGLPFPRSGIKSGPPIVLESLD